MILQFDLEKDSGLEIRDKFRASLIEALQHKVKGLTLYQAQKQYRIPAMTISRLRTDPDSIGIDKLLEMQSKIMTIKAEVV